MVTLRLFVTTIRSRSAKSPSLNLKTLLDAVPRPVGSMDTSPHLDYLLGTGQSSHFSRRRIVYEWGFGLAHQVPANKIKRIPKNDRSFCMRTGLTSVLGDSYSVTCLGNDSSHYCPFSGGGDVAILKSGSYSAATILDADADSDNEEPGTPCPQVPNVSPPKQGEYRWSVMHCMNCKPICCCYVLNYYSR